MIKKIALILMVLLFVSGNLFSLVIGYGGWNDTSVYISSKDNNNYFSNNLKLWMTGFFSKNVVLYLRGKLQYAKLMNPDSSSTSDDTQSVLDLDHGFLSINSDTLSANLGRANYMIGNSGVVFNGLGDGASLRLRLGGLTFSVFGAYTGLLLKDTNPYNRSSQDLTDGAKRLFAGGELRVQPFTGTTLYAGALMQKDQSDPEGDRYDSTYILAGVGGTIATSFNYNFEFVYQLGKSPYSGSESDVKAFAALLRLKYFFFDSANSGFTLDFAYATGSDNRESYMPNGLSSTGDDKQFIAFGAYSTGFSFEPDLSNLLYGALSFSTMPFSKTSIFARSTFLIKASLYMKAEKAAPISELNVSDTDNNSAEAFLGTAFDVTWSWRVVSDISLVLGAGVFKPGKAFNNQDTQFMAQSSIIISF